MDVTVFSSMFYFLF